VEPQPSGFGDRVDHLTRLVGTGHVGIDYVEKYQEEATVVAPPSVVRWRTQRPGIFRHPRELRAPVLSRRH
jgi:hypothetical protein